MAKLSEKYKYEVTPRAKQSAIVKGDKYRFTVLGSGLIRIEYNKNSKFEDRATQTVINRQFPEVSYKVEETDERIDIITDKITLTYQKGREFKYNTLSAHFYGLRSGVECRWHYEGEYKTWNLKGTTRTLDGVDGQTSLDEGIMSLDGFSVLDDSKSCIIEENGEIVKRDEEEIDIYLFAYKDDYYTALKDFYTLTGNPPLLPRYALGNMWSRYYPYTQDGYIKLMEKFKEEKIPFSVAVIDMDWHYSKDDPKYGSGWTGYTWNEELFPDYKKFLKDLHERDLEVTLNLHPADGVRANEKMYSQMAEAMGVKDGKAVEFDITDNKFIENYFSILHHPYEKDGVTFWWMDWQQGSYTKKDNIDPLWMLNHYHTVDMQNDEKRAMLLSRYAGVGSHRYPIGFSGDTVMTWESLDFQPYFTSTASNIGYTWWSHDIGGHMLGMTDDELMVRWVQYGVFSPINRLHSGLEPTTGKEPWNYGEIEEKVLKDFMRLRHELIPYMYTMNYKTHTDAKPLITPLYYNHPKEDCSWAHSKEYKNEYYFGSELLVSPITTPNDNITKMGSVNTYIPDGIWFDFFNGLMYKGGKSLRLFRNIHQMPVLAKAGAIVPLAEVEGNDVSNPENMKIRVFAGADNSFELYEDDGKSMAYQKGAYAITKFSLKHSEKPEFIIKKPQGDNSLLPEKRNYDVEFNGYSKCNSFKVTQDGKNIDYSVSYEDTKTIIHLENVVGEIVISFGEKVSLAGTDKKKRLIDLIVHAQGLNSVKNTLYNMVEAGLDKATAMEYFYNENIDKNLAAAVLELICD